MISSDNANGTHQGDRSSTSAAAAAAIAAAYPIETWPYGIATCDAPYADITDPITRDVLETPLVVAFQAAYRAATNDDEREAAIDAAFDAADEIGDANPDANGCSDDRPIRLIRFALQCLRIEARHERARKADEEWLSIPENAASRRKHEADSAARDAKARAEHEAREKARNDAADAADEKWKAEYAEKCRVWERSELEARLGGDEVRKVAREREGMLAPMWQKTPPDSRAGHRRPRLCTVGDFGARIEMTVAAVTLRNSVSPQLFNYLDNIGRVRKKDGRSVVSMCEPSDLQTELNDICWYYKPPTNALPLETEVRTPMEIADHMLHMATLPKLPVLHGVIAVPRFFGKGVLVTAPGYHPSGWLYDPKPGLKIPEVPMNPTAEQSAYASGRLYELFEGFAFKDACDPEKHPDDKPEFEPWARRKLYGQASRANAIGALLTPFIRPMVGLTPFFLFDKATQRVGASKLINGISLVATGDEVAFAAFPQTEEELEKRLVSELREPSEFLVFDNIEQEVRSASLSMMLTSGKFKGRELGASRMIRGEPKWITAGTGVNVKLYRDIAARTVRIRQDPGVERPQDRTDFMHPDWEVWIRQNHADLIWCCLVIIQAWIAAGKPLDKSVRFGGAFDNWAQTIGGVLRHAGIEGFLGNMSELAAVDTESQERNAFGQAWWGTFGLTVTRCGDQEKPIERGSLIPSGDCGGLLRMMQDTGTDVEGVDLKKSPSACRSALGKKLKRWEGAPLSVHTEQGDILVMIKSVFDRRTKSWAWRLERK